MTQKLLRPVVVIIVLALAMAGYFLWQRNGEGPASQRYKTQAVDRGDVVQSVTANGTLNPVSLVNVGTQVSGTIKVLQADYNHKVQPGQVLAELDPALFQAAVKQSEANVANAQAALKLARTKEQRTRSLVEKNFISRAELDSAIQGVESAQAQLALAQAQLERDRTNLRYSVIRSPISGVVVARNIDVGQTVAASFQTPTLFQIARDLRDMQIDTSVAEADVGNIRVDMPVRFGVDAYPDVDFKGKVKQIRLAPVIQQNVVTYNVVVGVDNADEKLLPGMTANIRIAVNRREKVLRVPNAALRFRPAGEEEQQGGRRGKRGPPTVYKLAGEKLVPVPIQTGISDGAFTEVVGGELKEGDAVVTRENATGKPQAQGNIRLRMF
jgi:HlyD family secretion protein